MAALQTCSGGSSLVTLWRLLGILGKTGPYRQAKFSNYGVVIGAKFARISFIIRWCVPSHDKRRPHHAEGGNRPPSLCQSRTKPGRGRNTNSRLRSAWGVSVRRLV